MKLIFIAVSLILTIQAQAQDLTKIIRYKDPQQKNIEYYVLQKNNNSKKGKYQLVNKASKFVLKEGYFKDNLKDSLWIEYLPGTPHKMKEGYYLRDKKHGIWRENVLQDNYIFLRAKGSYREDVRVGPWQFFNKEGETLEVYDYSRDTLLFAKNPLDSVRVAVWDVWVDNVWQKRKLGKGPAVISDKSGNDPFYEIPNLIRYPVGAASKGIEGIVLIGFSVSAEGSVSDFYVHKKVHPLLDAEALRVAKLLTLNFTPGLLNGKPVITKMLLPIGFSIR